MKLDFIIIGGQKCGSTYLHAVINQHPEIEMLPGECPHFESPDYENNGMTKLKSSLNSLNQNKLLGIKRPNYLCKNEVINRINKVNEKIKLIVILRNPIERFKSAYFHNMNYSFSPIIELNKGIDKLLSGRLRKTYPRTDELIEFGYYSQNLKKYKELYDDRLLILFYDDLKKNKLDVIKKCYSFLGVDNSFIPHESYLNSKPQKVNYSLNRTRLLSKKNKFQYKYNKNKTRLTEKKQSNFDKLICKSIDNIDRKIFNKYLINTKKPEFTKASLQKLKNIYKDDIKELEELCDVNLSHWLI